MWLHTGVYRHWKRVCTESWLWEKDPLPPRGIEPASATCRSDALPTELHPVYLFTYHGNKIKIGKQMAIVVLGKYLKFDEEIFITSSDAAILVWLWVVHDARRTVKANQFPTTNCTASSLTFRSFLCEKRCSKRTLLLSLHCPRGETWKELNWHQQYKFFGREGVTLWLIG